MNLEELRKQRVLFEGNKEVCDILDKQILALTKEFEEESFNGKLAELKDKLTIKIKEHKTLSERSKRDYANAKAELERYAIQLEGPLKKSLNEINLLKNEIALLSNTERKSLYEINAQNFVDIFMRKIIKDIETRSKR